MAQGEGGGGGGDWCGQYLLNYLWPQNPKTPKPHRMQFKVYFSCKRNRQQVCLSHCEDLLWSSKTFSNRVVSGCSEQTSWFITTLNSADLLEEGTVHFRLLRVHQAAELLLFRQLINWGAVGACVSSHTVQSHLILQEIGISNNFLLAGSLNHGSTLISNLGLLNPLIHVRLVSSHIVIHFHFLLRNLAVQLLIKVHVHLPLVCLLLNLS